jgi:hypothetical protein
MASLAVTIAPTHRKRHNGQCLSADTKFVGPLYPAGYVRPLGEEPLDGHVAFLEKPRLQLAKETHTDKIMFQIYFQAIVGLAATTVTALAAAIMDTDTASKILLTYIVLGLTFFSSARLARCVWLLYRLAVIVSRPDG